MTWWMDPHPLPAILGWEEGCKLVGGRPALWCTYIALHSTDGELMEGRVVIKPS